MPPKIVITGRGLVTPIGTGLAANIEALKAGRAGIKHVQEWADLGLDVQVAGISEHEAPCPMFTPKNVRFMSPNTRMAIVAAYEALKEAGLTPENLEERHIAVINGCAGSSYDTVYHQLERYMQTKRARACSPFSIPRIMPSSAVASMSLLFGTTGESYDISCACTSSALAIIAGMRLIRSGEYDMVLVGGSEEVSWGQSLGFSIMRALSSHYNDRPECASRPFDRDRDGFVLAEGAGMLVLESEEHALKRGIKPKIEISGFGANSNATDMVVPSASSSADVMRAALRDANLQPSDIVYINTHGTATPVGDPVELEGIHQVFEDRKVAINSTKAMTGHMIGASGSVEAIFTSLMMEHSFICKCVNLENPSEGLEWADLVRELRTGIDIKHAISNSFGFGGSNATLVFSKY